MASETAVAQMMKVLSRNFAGDVTREKCRLYHAALNDVDDAQLAEATKRIIREHRGEFIPPVAVIRDACGANTRAPAFDSEAILRAISALGEYHVESARWCYPSLVKIEAQLGAGIAQAYSAAGAALCFSNSETTREIAQREFVHALTRISEQRGAAALALPSGDDMPRQLASGDAASRDPTSR